MGVLGPARRPDRAVRLPAAAQRAAPGAADHRDRRVVHPAERRPAPSYGLRRPINAPADLPADWHGRDRRRHDPGPAASSSSPSRSSLMVALQLFVGRTRLGRAMRSTAQDRDAAAADGREHQPDDRDHVPHRLGARGRRGRGLRPPVRLRPLTTSASTPASRRSPRPSSAASATPSAPRSAASSSGSSRSAPRSLGYSRWGAGHRVRRPRHRARVPARPASSASRPESGHERRRTIPAAAAPRRPASRGTVRRLRRPPPVDDDPHRHGAGRRCCCRSSPAPAVHAAPAPGGLDRRLHQRRRLRPARASA